MKRWEYLTELWVDNASESKLDELGKNCWELICVTTGGLYIFKRPVDFTNTGTTDSVLLVEEPQYPSH